MARTYFCVIYIMQGQRKTNDGNLETYLEE